MLGIAFGTRPEWLKIKPVVDELIEQNVPYRLIFTGQHEDLVADVTFDYRYYIHDLCFNRLDNIVYHVLEDAHNKIGKLNLSALMVQGDTTSAFACALAAFHRKIPVIHLEAGLRTYDNAQPFPEEANRRMISAIASVNLCPTEESCLKLSRELVPGSKHFVGNTVLDNIKDVKTGSNGTVLVTMHRRENQENMAEWFRSIDALAQANPHLRFVLPIHPNPEVKKHKDILKRVIVVDPLSHDALIGLLANSEAVVTDSGGIQEEAAFLRKPCIVCREATERPEGLGNFSLLCETPSGLSGAYKDAMMLPMSGDCPYGDGNSAKRVVKIVQGL